MADPDPKPLPIPSYDASIGYSSPESPGIYFDAVVGGRWCDSDDVREMLEARDKSEAQRDAACQMRERAAELNVLSMAGRLREAEAQRDRLAAVLRLALNLAQDQDDHLGSWSEVWAQADEALAAIDKENA